ncbi:trypsin-like peptidase domain-containing protein, partial [Myxococcota bacterium]|nr:trypsin-like peptidase domain-containing protein [Myxococcota bacterium]
RRGFRGAIAGAHGARPAGTGGPTFAMPGRTSMCSLRAFAAAVLIVLAAGGAAAADPFLRRTATVRVVEKVGPSVVNITTERLQATPSPFSSNRQPDIGPLSDDFFDHFFESGGRRTQSLGSGVIFDRNGHVLTNEHVVARAEHVAVTLGDGREFDAELVGADPNNDLAVLRILTDDALPFTPPGDSHDLMVGEPVIAIGNPFGFSNSVTTGVISALDRSLNARGSFAFHGLLQTDAAINPGNSGGPLLNAEGELVGINAAIFGGAQGIGFAIPIDVARRVIRELLLYGEVHPVWLGLEFQDLDPELRRVLAVPRGIGGVLINRLHPDSPASRAGIRRGDLVASLDGRAIRDATQLFEMLEGMTAGQSRIFELFRDGKLRKAQVTAEELPQAMVDSIASRKLGLELELVPKLGSFEITQVAPESAAAKLGLRAGDHLLRMNGVTLASREDLRRAVARLRSSARALIVVQRGPGRYHLTLPLI